MAKPKGATWIDRKQAINHAVELLSEGFEHEGAYNHAFLKFTEDASKVTPEQRRNFDRDVRAIVDSSPSVQVVKIDPASTDGCWSVSIIQDGALVHYSGLIDANTDTYEVPKGVVIKRK